MKKLFNYKNVLYCSWLSAFEINKVDLEKYKEARGLYIEDPWERVKSIFSQDGFGNWHPELTYAIQISQIGACAGAIYGGILSSIIAHEKYIRTSETDIFQNKKHAFRAHNNAMLLNFGKGALKWAPKFALFCGSFSLISSCGALYRNKHGIIENTLGGFVSGAIFKISFGIKGLISGGLVGGFLGTIYGLTLCGIEKLFHTDRVDLKYSQFAFSKYRKRVREGYCVEELNPNSSHIQHSDDPLEALATDQDVKESEEHKKNEK